MIRFREQVSPILTTGRATDRVRGELECLKGNFTDGEKLLENALRSAGYRPAAS